MQRSSTFTRTALAGLAALALVCTALATAGAPSAEANGGLIYFRDGVGASAKITYRKSGGMVRYKGRIWDRKGDYMHARIYGYSLGQPYGIRKATRGRSRAFHGSVPGPLFFEVCTYQRSREIRCTRRWTHN
jgi:hypothetical protein